MENERSVKDYLLIRVLKVINKDGLGIPAKREVSDDQWARAGNDNIGEEDLTYFPKTVEYHPYIITKDSNIVLEDFYFKEGKSLPKTPMKGNVFIEGHYKTEATPGMYVRLISPNIEVNPLFRFIKD